MNKIALFPGSFDPITIAHFDILSVALPLFDKVVIGLGINSTKQNVYTPDQRLNMLNEVYKNNPKIEIVAYTGLTVAFCKQIGATYMIRGIRSVADFEYEKAIAQMNHAMHSDVESLFILSKPAYSAISSTIVRDILRNGGDVSEFVPKEIVGML